MITDIVTAIIQFSQVQTSAVHPFCYIDVAVELLRIRCADTSADVPMITQTLARENFMGSLLRSVRVLRT